MQQRPQRKSMSSCHGGVGKLPPPLGTAPRAEMGPGCKRVWPGVSGPNALLSCRFGAEPTCRGPGGKEQNQQRGLLSASRVCCIRQVLDPLLPAPHTWRVY